MPKENISILYDVVSSKIYSMTIFQLTENGGAFPMIL